MGSREWEILLIFLKFTEKIGSPKREMLALSPQSLSIASAMRQKFLTSSKSRGSRGNRGSRGRISLVSYFRQPALVNALCFKFDRLTKMTKILAKIAIALSI
jgi:hypothetical protein